MTTCQIYTMPARRPAAIPSLMDHPHLGAPSRGGDAPERGAPPTKEGHPPFRGVECIHQTWGLFPPLVS